MSEQTSALIQAGAALIIAGFTYALWRATNNLAAFTKDYVQEMRRSNDLQSQMVSLQTLQMTKQAQAQAPSLVAISLGRTVGDRVEAPVQIENVGGAAAYDVEVITSWGPMVLTGPIPPGGGAQSRISVGVKDWEQRQDQDPVIARFTFKDPQGGTWKQEVGSAPEAT